MSPYTATIIGIFSDFWYFEIKPEMRDVLAKMRECGKYAKMRDFPHDCGTVDTYGMLMRTELLPFMTGFLQIGNTILTPAVCVSQIL